MAARRALPGGGSLVSVGKLTTARLAFAAAMWSACAIGLAVSGCGSQVEPGTDVAFEHRYAVLPGRVVKFIRAETTAQGAGVAAVRIDGGAAPIFVTSVADVVAAGASVRSDADAIAYSSMLRDFPPLVAELGEILEPGGPDGMRVPGRYSAEDARRWGVDPQVRATRSGDRWIVARPVVRFRDAPAEGPGAQAAYVVWVEELIGQDGRFEQRVVRELEAGPSVSRLARMLR